MYQWDDHRISKATCETIFFCKARHIIIMAGHYLSALWECNMCLRCDRIQILFELIPSLSHDIQLGIVDAKNDLRNDTF